MSVILKQSLLSMSFFLISTLSLAQTHVGGGRHGGTQHHSGSQYNQWRAPNNDWRGSGAVIPLGDLFDASCAPTKICNMFGQCRMYQTCE